MYKGSGGMRKLSIVLHFGDFDLRIQGFERDKTTEKSPDFDLLVHDGDRWRKVGVAWINHKNNNQETG